MDKNDPAYKLYTQLENTLNNQPTNEVFAACGYLLVSVLLNSLHNPTKEDASKEIDLFADYLKRNLHSNIERIGSTKIGL